MERESKHTGRVSGATHLTDDGKQTVIQYFCTHKHTTSRTGLRRPVLVLAVLKEFDSARPGSTQPSSMCKSTIAVGGVYGVPYNKDKSPSIRQLFRVKIKIDPNKISREKKDSHSVSSFVEF